MKIREFLQPPSSFLLLMMLLMNAVLHAQQQEVDSFVLLEPVELRATRATERAPFTKSGILKPEIEKLNLGQDLPFILSQIPGVVVYSDAGNGVGYTGLRIRGTDASRINVTLNGIPFNDAESQGTFFVDLPDFVSSVGSIQVQRGVGTSSNGAGAFGATINISTNEANKLPYAEFNNSYGSFNTRKHTLKTGSGLVAGHFTTDLRISGIYSDGFIDRASSRLSSYYFSTAWIANKASLRFNHFSGNEKTYQAWYGVSENDLKVSRTINYAGMERPGSPYENETDNYKQDHFQLFYNQQAGDKWRITNALFYVKGKGFYEQYKADQEYSDYGQPAPAPGISTTDLVRQLWLDNDFYGNILSVQHNRLTSQYILGGGYTRYDGSHFGDVIWAANGLALPARWYDLDAFKTDFNIYLKQESRIGRKFTLFYDLQYRSVRYHIYGFRNNPGLVIQNKYRFLNPKAGLSYAHGNWFGYVSFSRGQKEPNRDDFEVSPLSTPRPEQLNDFEIGIRQKTRNLSWETVLYYMHYRDQLVLNGKINDVGAYTRVNIPKSYRMGIEFSAAGTFHNWIRISGNLALSRNKVLNFTEFIDDYDNGGQQSIHHHKADISFSPAVIANGIVQFQLHPNFELALFSKYTGKQFLDNTQNDERKLDPFFVEDARLIYAFRKGRLKEARIILQANNILDEEYEPNGYTFSYIYGGIKTTENYYYPMAGRNFVVAVNLKF